MPRQFVQELNNFIKGMPLLDADKVEEKDEGGEIETFKNGTRLPSSHEGDQVSKIVVSAIF